MTRRTVRTLSRAVDNIVLLTLLVILVLASWAFYDSRLVDEEATADKYETYKPVTEEDTKSFEELRVMNPDVLGWITIYDTTIDYPLVQSKTNNSEYLSRNPEREFQSSGSIYLDTHNNPNFTDFNSVIQGHHMANHRMFGDLELFTEREFFDTHQYGNLFFNNRNHGLEFFAVLKVDAHTSLIQNPGITDESEKQEYLNQIYSRALYTRDIGVNPQDHVVVLSTCALDMTNGRFLLFAKLHDGEIPNPFPEEESSSRSGNRLDIFSIVNQFKSLPLWLWIVILIALIILTWLLYRAELRRIKRKKEKRLCHEQLTAKPQDENGISTCQ